jgi:uncharacterized protein YbjT (DUF2867 family)
MSAPLGVTGSTGQVGGRIARLLAAAGAEQRLVVRTPARAPLLPGTTVAAASYLDRDAVRRALDGLDVVLMVSAAEAENRLEEHRAFVDAAADAGVRHWSTSPSSAPRPRRRSRSPATTTSPSSTSSSRAWRGRTCATTSTRTSSR